MTWDVILLEVGIRKCGHKCMQPSPISKPYGAILRQGGTNLWIQAAYAKLFPYYLFAEIKNRHTILQSFLRSSFSQPMPNLGSISSDSWLTGVEAHVDFCWCCLSTSRYDML